MEEKAKTQVSNQEKSPESTPPMDFGLAGDRIYFNLGYKLFLFIFVFICVVGIRDIFWVLIYYFLLQKGIPAVVVFVYSNWSKIVSGQIFIEMYDVVLRFLRRMREKARAAQKKDLPPIGVIVSG
jgi:hypothetical protein